MALNAKYLPHYTYEDYEHWEGRWELIHGIPYAMSPAPNLWHQRISQRIAATLERSLEHRQDCQALLPVDWKIADDIVVQPDNLVVCGPVSGQYLTTPPVLIFEILSPPTAQKDRHLKFELYEQQGVRYYVVVDPKQEAAEVFELRDGAYASRGTSREGAATFDLGPCEITVDLARLWR